jgi:hypothetical protein
MVEYASDGTVGAYADARAYALRHARFGWWSLLVFLSLGVILEALHGFKAGIYLDVSNETRRLMWTLAHAHGTLLSLVHLVFGMYLTIGPRWPERSLRIASQCLFGASFLLPVGFFLGGVDVHAGDPGLGVLLVPLGAGLLFTTVVMAARSAAGEAERGDVR